MQKKGWKKRAASVALTAAMVVSQIGVWNVSVIEVDAATDNWVDTTLVANGNFEDENLSGWTFDMPTADNDTNGYKLKTDDGATNNTTQYLNFWTTNTTNFSMKQEISNVPAGTYRLLFDQEGTNAKSGLTIGVNDIRLEQSATTGWNNWATVNTDSIILTETGNITITVSGEIAAGYWGDFDNFVLQRYEGDTEGGDQEEGYAIDITANAESVEVGNTITLTAKVTNNGEEITNLKQAGLHLYWWDNTNNSDGWFVDYDGTNGYALTLKVNPQKAGNYEIQAKLQDSGWKDLKVGKYNLAVVESSTAVEGDLNIAKVENLSDDFIMGMDISSVISEFDSGVTYKDYDGKVIDNVTDFCKFLADNGITHIRVRVWNDPYDSNGNGYGGGNNDVEKAKKIADACSAAGIKMLVDFHCSDLWTDPGKQQAPKAWKNYSLEEKETALTAFIMDSLSYIDPDKDTVAMVQVGNETTSGFVGEKDVEKMCALFNAGADGVRAYNKEVKVVIHVTNPEKGNMTRWAKNLSENNVDYDILATSYYPY